MRIDPIELRRTRRLAKLSGALTLALGAVCFAGWLLDDSRLKTGLTGDVSMKANAALGIALGALSLLTLLPEERDRRALFIARAAASTMLILGAVTLTEHLFDWDAGIDQLLFTEPRDQPATASPGRMGPPACLAFIALGLGFLLFDRRTARGHAPSQYLSVVPMVLGTLGLLGYLTGATQLYGIARFSGIALPMALAILSLALGLFVARAELAPASLLVLDNAGGQLARTMLPTTILLPLLLGWVRTEGQTLGLYDVAFGRALFLLSLIVVFTAIVWWVSVRLSGVARARALAEQASTWAQAEAARLASENLQTLSVLDALLVHAPIGLVFFDRARHCVRVNEFMRSMQPNGAVRGVGDDLRDVLPGASEALEAAIVDAFERGISTRDLVLVEGPRDSTQEERSWLTGIFPVDREGAEVMLVGAFIVEITERRRLEAQRSALLESERSARSEAERAASLKDQFLATLSHELRTPLNAIMGWVAVAQRTKELPESIARPLAIIERNAHAQAQLIEDLLDVSRIVSGKLKLDLQPVALASTIETVVLAMRPAADKKQVRLETKVAAMLPRVMADPVRLQQIVSNLLANAIKFTPQGKLVALTVDASEDAVRIEVRDEGIGIAPAFLPHVFERFRQADATTTRHHGGLGLGLAIVKQLTELHGGRVTVHSAGEQQGTTFVVTLPRATPEVLSAAPRAMPRQVSSASLAGASVLVVDDEPDAREFVARVLTDAGALVMQAGDVDEALARIAAQRPDLLVSDIGMPGKDGYALIEAVRREHGPDQMPAIAVTAFARPEDSARALAAGFQRHLAKPLDPYEVLDALAQLGCEDQQT